MDKDSMRYSHMMPQKLFLLKWVDINTVTKKKTTFFYPDFFDLGANVFKNYDPIVEFVVTDFLPIFIFGCMLWIKKKKRNYKKEINLMNSTTSSCFSNWSTNSFWSGRLIWMLFIFFGFLALWLLSTSNFLFLIAAEIYFVLNRRFWQLKIWICTGNFF